MTSWRATIRYMLPAALCRQTRYRNPDRLSTSSTSRLTRPIGAEVPRPVRGGREQCNGSGAVPGSDESFPRTLLLNARIISSEQEGQPMLLLAIDDITERRQAEATLREREQRYRLLLNALPVAVYTTEAEGRITLFNEAAAAFAGRRAQTG